MAIQIRRGNFSDLDRSQLQPGEFAAELDQLRLLLCFTAGSAEEIPLDKNTLSWKYGLGVGDLDMFVTPGIYSQTVSSHARTANHYPVEGATGTLVVVYLHYGSAEQGYQYYLAQSSNEIYYRRYVSSAWTDWVQLYPGVISGSNSNGRYVKYPDGTMICWCNGSKSVLSTGGITVTFPEAFIDNAYSAHANAINLSNYLSKCDNTSASSTNVWFFKATDGTAPSTGTSVNYSVMAVGRWK